MTRNKKAALLVGLTIFWLLIGLFVVRFVLIKDNHVHYHANFALYINGQRDEFKNFTFYEEVQSCGTEEQNNPKTRVHMHDQKNSVVHVHDQGATWGHFFANLGYGLTNNSVETDKGVFKNDDGSNKLTFTLNGKKVESIANATIKSEDTLLINYGNEGDDDLNKRASSIPNQAQESNMKPDPATCSGSGELKTGDRFKKALQIWQ